MIILAFKEKESQASDIKTLISALKLDEIKIKKDSRSKRLSKPKKTPKVRVYKDPETKFAKEHEITRLKYDIPWEYYNALKSINYDFYRKHAHIVRIEAIIVFIYKNLESEKLDWLRKHVYEHELLKNYSKTQLENCIKNLYRKYFSIGKHQKGMEAYAKELNPIKVLDLSMVRHSVKHKRQPGFELPKKKGVQYERNYCTYSKIKQALKSRKNFAKFRAEVNETFKFIYEYIKVKDLNGNILPKKGKNVIVYGEIKESKNGHRYFVLRGNREITRIWKQLVDYVAKLKGNMKLINSDAIIVNIKVMANFIIATYDKVQIVEQKRKNTNPKIKFTKQQPEIPEPPKDDHEWKVHLLSIEAKLKNYISSYFKIKHKLDISPTMLQIRGSDNKLRIYLSTWNKQHRDVANQCKDELENIIRKKFLAEIQEREIEIKS